MANLFLNLPAPAANSAGASINVSTLGATKTIVMKGNGTAFEPFVTIEGSNDPAQLVWTSLAQFTKAGEQTINVSCAFMRARTSNYVSGGAPTVDVGSTDIGTQSATLVATAGNGSGAGVDVSAIGDFATIQVAGTYKGSVNIEVSNDAGTSWAQAAGLSFIYNGIPTMKSSLLVADYFRVTRSGIPDREPNPGLPVVYVCGSELAGSSTPVTVDVDGLTITGDGSAGDPLVAEGVLLAVQRLSGSGTYTPTAGTKKAWVRMVGGGGGGGAIPVMTAGNSAAGGGGGSGTFLERFFSNAAGITGGAYVVGAGGASATDGTNTTLTIEAVAMVAGFGGNGSSGVDGLTNTNSRPGGAGGLSTAIGGTSGFVSRGQGGQPGVALSGTSAWGGAGGNTPFGSGGGPAWVNDTTFSSVGNAASANAFGGGGGGAVRIENGAALAGGAGAAGTIIIYEYS